MTVQGSIDHLYRVADDSVVVSGWCSIADAIACLSWSDHEDQFHSVCFGSYRIQRPDVIAALSSSPHDPIPPDCGFVVLLAGVSELAQCLHLKIESLAWTLPVVDLRLLPISDAIDCLIDLANWGSTPAEVVHGLIASQGLGLAVCHLLNANSWDIDGMLLVNKASLDPGSEVVVVLVGSQDINVLHLQIVSILDALQVCERSVAFKILANPLWCLLSPVEMLRLRNSLSLLGLQRVAVLPSPAGFDVAEDLCNCLGSLASCSQFVILGSYLLLSSSNSLARLCSVLVTNSERSSHLFASSPSAWSCSDVSLFEVPDLCLLLSCDHDAPSFRPPPAEIRSLFRDISISVDYSLDRQRVKGLAYWRDVVKRFVLSSGHL
jgi:hypothetical protein